MTLLKRLQSFTTSRLSALIAIIYIVIAYSSLQLAFQGTNASPVWPPSGFAFTVVWFFGYRVWPGIWLGAFMANLLVFLNNGWTAIPAIPVSVLIGIGNSMEALFGVFLLRSFTEEIILLSKIRDIFKFVFSVLVACLFSATIGTTAVFFTHPPVGIPFDMIWFTWWLGDVVGILVIASFFLTFHRKLWQFSSWKNALEAILVGLVLIIVNAGVFMGKFPEYGFYSHVTYLVLPFAIWATYRFGFPGASISIFITSFIAVFGSIFHLGPFVSQHVPEDLEVVECFIGVIAVTVLSLAAALYERLQAEEEIKHNEARFRSLVENSYEIVAMVSAQAKVLYTSPPTKNVLGYENSETIGLSMFEWMHPDDVPQVSQIFQGLLKTPGATAHATCRIHRKDGTWRWMEGSGCNLLHLPAVAAVVVNYRDITEKKQSEERFRQVVESAPNAMVMVDDKGSIQLVNKATEELFGYERDELLRMKVEELVPERFRGHHPEYRDGFHNDPKSRAMGAGRDLYGLKKDGSEVPIEIGLNPIDAEGGKFVLASIVNITERKNSQLAIEESERRFRTMADTAPVMIWMSGEDGLYSYCNKAWLTFIGQTMHNVLGNGWRLWIHPEDFSRCLQVYLKAFKDRESFTLDYRLKRADGAYRWVLDTGVPRFNSEGYFGGFIGSCIDITDRKLAEEVLKRDKDSLVELIDERSKELIKTQKELKHFSRLADIGTLAATVAHELRNPLGVIHLAAYNLRREKSDLGTNKHLVNIEKKVWEGNQIIDNLLSYARIKIPNYENVRILNMLDECVASAQVRFGEKGITIEKHYSDGLDFIEADPNQIREIFLNILNNACQSFATPSGKVDITAQSEKDMVKVTVQDAGVGIDQEDLDKVFEPFFTRKSKGTGLGLTICNELVNLHQGKIEIDSKKGQGTKVTVLLPVHRRDHDDEAASH